MGIMKYAIMDGVAGGATVAVRQRRVGETADILLWGKEPHISCANYGLPHCMGSVIVEHEKLLAQNEMLAILRTKPLRYVMPVGKNTKKTVANSCCLRKPIQWNFRRKAFALEVSLHCAM